MNNIENSRACVERAEQLIAAAQANLFDELSRREEKQVRMMAHSFYNLRKLMVEMIYTHELLEAHLHLREHSDG